MVRSAWSYSQHQAAFTYLWTPVGIKLSYGAFELQSMRARITRAEQVFGSLRHVLRTCGPLSTEQRLRMYRVCVSPALYYGLASVGMTAATLKMLVTAQAQHLRILLRVHEHGHTNKQVLARAEVCPLQALRKEASRQLDAINRDAGSATTWLQLFVVLICSVQLTFRRSCSSLLWMAPRIS